MKWCSSLFRISFIQKASYFICIFYINISHFMNLLKTVRVIYLMIIIVFISFLIYVLLYQFKDPTPAEGRVGEASIYPLFDCRESTQVVPVPPCSCLSGSGVPLFILSQNCLLPCAVQPSSIFIWEVTNLLFYCTHSNVCWDCFDLGDISWGFKLYS